MQIENNGSRNDFRKRYEDCDWKINHLILIKIVINFSFFRTDDALNSHHFFPFSFSLFWNHIRKHKYATREDEYVSEKLDSMR